MSRLRGMLFALCVGAVGFACGGTSSGLIPAQSPLVKFQPPETEDLLPDTATTSDEDDADEWNEDDLNVDEASDTPPAGDGAQPQAAPAKKP